MAFDNGAGLPRETGRRSYSGTPAQRIRDNVRDRDTRPVTVLLLSLCVLLVAGLVAWIVVVRGLPTNIEVDRSRFDEASVVYSADGEELSRYQDKNRTWVSVDEISDEVIEALIAVEDHRFFSHSGVDLQRTIGSIFRTVGGDAQGGSTITMQFARNAFPSLADDMTPARKIKEWIVALKLEGRYEKEEILEMYLNTVPFMYNAFGIEAGARTYFQKPASALDLKESATLIGMLRGTSYYNPVRNPERSHERRNVVLTQMVRHGFLDEETYDDVKDEETELNFRRLSRTDNMAPYFSEYLRNWLDEWAQDNEYNLYTDGLQIHTTIDSRLQQAADQAVREIGEDLQAVADVDWSAPSPPLVSSNAAAYRSYRENIEPFSYFWQQNPETLNDLLTQTQRFRELQEQGLDQEASLDSLRSNEEFVNSVKTIFQQLQAALVAIDPRSGEVRAWVGGRDFDLTQFDNVAQARRQPGSTFKPFVYAAALEQGYRSTDMVRDRELDFVDPQTGRRWSPQNVGDISGELMTLKDGLAYSKNTITAQVTIDVGPDRVADVAHRMGIESELLPYPSLGLGTSEVSLYELTSAYGTIADLGEYDQPVFVTRIENRQGRVLAEFRSSNSRRALAPETAYELIEMMQGVIEYGTGVRMQQYGAGGSFAGKTGTSQDGADGWFMLMHPNLVVGSWVGFNSSALTFRNDYWGQGSRTALPIVGEFFQGVRQSGHDVFASGTWSPPPGYSPPPSPDTLRIAADDGRFDSLIDSLRAVTDSLIARGEVDEDPEPRTEDVMAADSLNRIERGLDPDSPTNPDEPVANETEEEPPVDDEEEEQLSESDRLNRQQSIDVEAPPDNGGEEEQDSESGNRRGGW